MKVAIMALLVMAIRESQQGGSQTFVSDLTRGLAGRGTRCMSTPRPDRRSWRSR
jgi:hypothetical protein